MHCEPSMQSALASHQTQNSSQKQTCEYIHLNNQYKYTNNEHQNICLCRLFFACILSECFINLFVHKNIFMSISLIMVMMAQTHKI